MDDGLECFDEDLDQEQHQLVDGFFGCYLLVSVNPKFRGKTYIGFTVNPNRRIRQHNAGRCQGGAKSTAGKGPWEMVLLVHDFPNEISALRFEWAWQHPALSRRLSTSTVARKRPKESSFDYRFRVLAVMLRTGPWDRLGLRIRWVNAEYARDFPLEHLPPLHMPVYYGSLTSSRKAKNVVSKQQSASPSGSNGVCGICKVAFKSPLDAETATPTAPGVVLVCPAACPLGQWHMLCLAGHLLVSRREEATGGRKCQQSTEEEAAAVASLPDYLIPLSGTCPACSSVSLFWPDLISVWRAQRPGKRC